MTAKNKDLWIFWLLLAILVTAGILLIGAVWRKLFADRYTPPEPLTAQTVQEQTATLPPPLPQTELDADTPLAQLAEPDRNAPSAPLTEEELIQKKQKILSAVFDEEDSHRLSRVFSEIKKRPIVDEEGKELPKIIAFPMQIVKARREERRQIVETALLRNIDTQSPKWQDMMNQLYPPSPTANNIQTNTEIRAQDEAEKLL